MNRIDVDTKKSDRNDFWKWYEVALRKFQNWMTIASLIPLYCLMGLVMGLAATPGVYWFQFLHSWSAPFATYLRYPILGMAAAQAFLLYGFSMILIIPLVNFLTVRRVKPWRGPFYSAATARWFIHNGLTYFVRYTFLELITPTPFNILFYRLMGMKIGRGVQINSSRISDPSLITMEDKVTLGGSVTLVAHYGQAGFLIIAPTILRKGCTIGLNATIMGGVEIGENAKILPGSVVLPKTQVPAGETWGGIPARKIDIRDHV